MGGLFPKPNNQSNTQAIFGGNQGSSLNTGGAFGTGPSQSISAPAQRGRELGAPEEREARQQAGVTSLLNKAIQAKFRKAAGVRYLCQAVLNMPSSGCGYLLCLAMETDSSAPSG